MGSVFRYLGLAAILVVLAGLGMLHFSSEPEPSVWGETGSLSSPAVQGKGGKPLPTGEGVLGTELEENAGTARVDVLVDGWSARVLKGAELSAETSQGVSLGSAELVPVSREDLAHLLETSPGLVQDVFARLVTGAGDLSCDSEGCRAGNRVFDVPALVSSPAEVEGLGEVYKSWGVSSLLWRASFTVDTSEREVAISAPGFSQVVLPTLPAGSTPEAANGWLRNRHLVGAAFGRLFPVRPTWVGDDGTRYVPSAARPVMVDSVSSPLLHVTGLTTPRPRSAEMSASFLTYASSPTTGCDVGVVCTPEAVSVKVGQTARETALVCNSDDVSNLAVVESAVVSPDYGNRSTHQFGMWNGKPVDEFKYASDGGVLRGGLPPLVRGEQSQRWTMIALLSGDDAQLRATAGFFGPADSPAVSLDDALAGVSIDGDTWRRCS